MRCLQKSKRLPLMMRTTEDVLFEPEQSLSTTLFVCSVYEDQKPLLASAGMLDWRLKGSLSKFVKLGWITGKQSEFVYIPIATAQGKRHLLLVGLGSSEKKMADDTEIIREIVRATRRLQFKKIALSKSSFPFIEKQTLEEACAGFELEVMT